MRDMKKQVRIPHLIGTVVLLAGLSLLAACNLSPVRSYAPMDETPAFQLPTSVPTSTPTPQATATALPSEADCTNYMSFVEDINLPDGFVVSPGSVVDKQWMVRNTGTCNWGPGYVLQVTDNDGDVIVQSTVDLYPALKDASVIIRIEFTAPETEGDYYVRWDPMGPDDEAFDEYLSVQFSVQQPSE